MVQISVCVNGNNGGNTIISRTLVLEKELKHIPRKNEDCVLECSPSNNMYLKVKGIYHVIDSDNVVRVVLSEINGDRYDFEEITNFLMSKGWLVLC